MEDGVPGYHWFSAFNKKYGTQSSIKEQEPLNNSRKSSPEVGVDQEYTHILQNPKGSLVRKSFIFNFTAILYLQQLLISYLTACSHHKL